MEIRHSDKNTWHVRTQLDDGNNKNNKDWCSSAGRAFFMPFELTVKRDPPLE